MAIVKVGDIGYYARFYGPVNRPAGEQITSKDPIILTPERAAYDGWYMYQQIGLYREGDLVPFMTVMKEVSANEPPGYRILWHNSLRNGQSSLMEKLSPMLRLHQRLADKGYYLGKSKVVLQGRTIDFTDYTEIPIEDVYTPENQQLIDSRKLADVKSDWMWLFVDNIRPFPRAGIWASRYFGAEPIVSAFKDSFGLEFLTAEDLLPVERHLDDLIRGFPPVAPGRLK